MQLKPVLMLNNLSIPVNQKVALVGDYETPLSTIFDALLRIPCQTEGIMELNGVNLDDLGRNDIIKLRQSIFYLEKDLPIFSEDLKTNINPEFKNTDLQSKDYIKIFEILKKFAQFGKKLDSFGLNMQVKFPKQSIDFKTYSNKE